MDAFQHVSDVDIHLVNMGGLDAFPLETSRYFKSLPPSIFYMLFVGSSRHFHD